MFLEMFCNNVVLNIDAGVGICGHGKMSVAVRACACNERGGACMCVEYAGSFIYHYKIYGSTRSMAAFYSKE